MILNCVLLRTLHGTDGYSAMYICICEQVTDRQIKNAIENGATSMCKLRKELGVASQCGKCGRCAKAMLDEHAPKPFSSTFPIFREALLTAD